MHAALQIQESLLACSQSCTVVGGACRRREESLEFDEHPAEARARKLPFQALSESRHETGNLSRLYSDCQSIWLQGRRVRRALAQEHEEIRGLGFRV